MRKRNNDHDIWQNYIGYLEKQYRDNDMGYNTHNNMGFMAASVCQLWQNNKFLVQCGTIS